jgi:two-component system invasion response regulator UvrY
MTITAFVVDDHEYIIDSVSRLLKVADIDVIASFTGLDGVVERYKALKPDVVLVDVRLNNRDHGINFCAKMLDSEPQVKLVILSQFDQPYLIEQAYNLGVLAYVKKDDATDHLTQAIQHAAQGENYLSPSVAQILAKTHISGSPSARLSEKELAVFTCLANGDKQDEIASKLGISVKMISHHSMSIKEKLAVDRPAQLTKLAIRYGLITADDT